MLMLQHLLVLSLPLTPHQSVGWLVGVLVAICAQTCVSVAPGLTLSDQLSARDSTRSSDDDPQPGLPRGRSAVHIHFQSAAVLRSSDVRVAPPRSRAGLCTQKHTDELSGPVWVKDLSDP
ncbi:hypothetical protein CRENBAI_007211 [Crenichthys baileyi]|uniref:Secreted protein n=1 Tax=Crenichthys baileyi TaxID=28760 RepID=A0AAV9RKF0_9TELE